MEGRLALVVCVMVLLGLTAVDGVNIDAPHEQLVTAGTDSLIRCAAKEEGEEKIDEVVWRGKDYHQLPSGGRFSVTREGLTISDVRESDSGLYICEIRLAHGSNHRHGTFYQKFIDVIVE